MFSRGRRTSMNFHNKSQNPLLKKILSSTLGLASFFLVFALAETMTLPRFASAMECSTKTLTIDGATLDKRGCEWKCSQCECLNAIKGGLCSEERCHDFILVKGEESSCGLRPPSSQKSTDSCEDGMCSMIEMNDTCCFAECGGCYQIQVKFRY